MHVSVLGATGATGRMLVSAALARGLTVTALVRDPQRMVEPDRAGLTVVTADIDDPGSVKSAVQGSEVLLSGLGHTKGGRPDTLTAGARAAVDSGVPRIVWLGA